MDDHNKKGQAVDLLQELGLKEYEAKCFVALSRLPQGTAKDISEISDVPRTRVYDAVQVLESKGLVEVQHSNPQKFRGVPVEEATETLMDEFETRTERLRETLESITPATVDDDPVDSYEVWTISGASAIEARSEQLIEDAADEVVLIVGDEAVLTERLAETLQTASEQGVSVFAGATSEALHARLEEAVPSEVVFTSQHQWLNETTPEDDVIIGRALLVDGQNIIVSTCHEENDTHPPEQAVVGQGFGNGIVTVFRRLLLSGVGPDIE